MINVTINCNPPEWGQHCTYQYINLKTVHYGQLVYPNHQDVVLTLFSGFKIWLVNCQMEKDDLNIKIVTATLLYNVCTLIDMMGICVTNNNKPMIHPKRMATYKK